MGANGMNQEELMEYAAEKKTDETENAVLVEIPSEYYNKVKDIIKEGNSYGLDKISLEVMFKNLIEEVI